jgi:FkbM family methyltransferase
MNAAEIIDRIMFELKGSIRKLFGIDFRYSIGGVIINLPPDHKLPAYQRKYKDYDRFLPHLVKYLSSGSLVVDVGANVGDTLAAMVSSNNDLRYICIEADDMFFDYLEANLELIESVYPSVKCRCINEFVGKNVNNIALEGVGGTKHAVLKDNEFGINSKPLDQILSEFDYRDISLIKTDVDGYDYDIINSAENILSVADPILYYECMYDQEDQLSGFIEILDFLISMEYTNFILFDNFGCLVTKSDSLDVIIQLLKYIWKQNAAEAYRTINYFDILAYRNSRKEVVERIIRTY